MDFQEHSSAMFFSPSPTNIFLYFYLRNRGMIRVESREKNISFLFKMISIFLLWFAFLKALDFFSSKIYWIWRILYGRIILIFKDISQTIFFPRKNSKRKVNLNRRTVARNNLKKQIIKRLTITRLWRCNQSILKLLELTLSKKAR